MRAGALVAAIPSATCTLVQTYRMPVLEDGPALCTNGRDDDLDGDVDAEERNCSP